MTHHTFRAIWPITEPVTFDDAIDEASKDVPALLRQARACATGPYRWTMRRGYTIPGSGGAHTVLVCEAPARPIERAELDDLYGGAA